MRSAVNLAYQPISSLSGKTIKNGFGYIESCDQTIDYTIIHDLIMKGEHKGKVIYVIRNYIPHQWTQILTDNFNTIIEQRGSHRLNDGFVSVQQIGSSQFSKNGSQYMRESNKAFDDLEQLLINIPPDVADELFLTSLCERYFLKQNIHFGPSRHKHGHACMATFRRWLDNGSMSLMPHEDKAQLTCAAADHYEIHRAPIVIAQNLCIEGTEHGGELVIWNIQPDDACRRQFDVVKTGYPYPPESLEDIECLEIKLNPGDIYFMNASCLHGVKNVINGSRLTAGRFIGHIPNNKVVYWT